ncbi:MAG: replicative DNA helicase [Phycisphaerales bacterium]|nr:replicative DNA helicase [Phycisphaerales bacterium]
MSERISTTSGNGGLWDGGGSGRGAGGRPGRGERVVATREMQKLFDRMPPHSLEAEMCLLGSMILDHQATAEIIGLVPSGEFFYSEAHGAIFEALKSLYDTRNSGDLVQLVEKLRDAEVLETVGGPEYLEQLAASVPSAANAPHYARIVRQKRQLRKLIETAGQILWDAYHVGGGSADADADAATAVLDKAEKQIFEIAEEAQGMDSATLATLLQEQLTFLMQNEGRAITGLDTGFYDLSEITSGLQKGELIIVAGRPSMGKTSFALNLAEQVARGGQPHSEHGPRTPVGFFSMEMSRQSVAQRLLCAYANVDSHHLRTNRLGKDDFARLYRVVAELSEAPIFIDDSPSLTVLQLRAKARRMVAQHGVKCLFIDYLQLMSAPGSARDGREREVSAVSRGIKALARELEIPIICLAQLNRGAEQREGNRPRMADLRESGSIEQDADVILLLHREEYYHSQDPEWVRENPDKAGVAEVIVAKQRNGPTGVIELFWDSKSTRFKNLSARGSFGAPPASGHAAPPMPPNPFAGAAAAPAIEPKPYSGFAPGAKTGPIENFRDGGGRDDAPWEDEPPAPAGDHGLPV